MITIRTENGDFDLYGNEKIVQTLSIFNLEDITGRSGDYTNEFSLPLTNNNRNLIEYANELNTINTFPYRRVSCEIYVDGTFFKSGFIAIESIKDDIKARFYTGNSNFYNLTKNLSLQDLDWDDLNHVWNYTNAYNSCINSYDYFYPVMDYNGQTLAGDILDIRKVLPATRVGSILTRIFAKLGYTYQVEHSTASIDRMCLPYSKRNPEISSATQLYNSVDIQNANNYTLTGQINATFRYANGSVGASFAGAYASDLDSDLQFNQIVTTGSSTNYNFTLQKYTAQYSGTYDYSCLAPLVDYDNVDFSFYPPIGPYNVQTTTYIVMWITRNGSSKTIGSSAKCSFGEKYQADVPGLYISTVNGLTQTFYTDTLTGSVYLEAGDTIEFELRTNIYFYGVKPNTNGVVFNTDYTNITANFSSEVQSISTLTIDLQSNLVFGGLITYSSMLPNIKCSDFIKDICIREGLLLKINEDTKTVKSFKLDKIKSNIPNALDWSDKLDETEKPDIKFKLESYAQNNYFKHKEDKSILIPNVGADYNLRINNNNLELNKDIYTSPFSESETRVFNGYNVAYVSLYNVTDSKFNYTANYRICYYDTIVSDFKITDGTTTSAYINTKRCYFIDDTDLTYAMGFSVNLIPKNSQTIIDILQNIKIIKVNLNLNINDIKNIDYTIPIYLSKFQSYFFVSSINQFDFINKDVTEVELIKLN